MRNKQSNSKASAERVVKDIRRKMRRHFSAEEKIRIVLESLRGDDNIAELCRKEGIAQSLYYTWSNIQTGRLDTKPPSTCSPSNNLTGSNKNGPNSAASILKKEIKTDSTHRDSANAGKMVLDI